jgi:hypothetical protein
MSLLIISCQQPSESEQNDKRKNQANLEAEEQAKAGQDQQNAQSLKLEADLKRRYRFYSALSAEYTGQIKIKDKDNKDIDIAVSLSSQPTIPLYIGDRIRTIEEVQADLQNLGFQSNFKFWNIKNPGTATGCLFSNAKAFHENGVVSFQSSSECPNVFQLSILPHVLSSKEIAEIKQSLLDAEASALAQRILSGEIQTVPSAFVRMQMTQNGEVRSFQLKKKPIEQQAGKL